VNEISPQAYFDQFIAWADQQVGWPENGQWCPRHWAPCPVQGANGIGAATEMMRIWSEAQPTIDPAALNVALRKTVEQSGAICCSLGDQVMFGIWANWPPTRRLEGQIFPEE